MKRLILTSVILALAIVFSAQGGRAQTYAQVAELGCKQSGIRYVGSIAPGRICFTITSNGTRIRELSWTMPRLLAKCSAGGSVELSDSGWWHAFGEDRSNRPQRQLQVRILGAGLQREPDGLERVRDSSMGAPSRLRHQRAPLVGAHERRHHEAGAHEAGAHEAGAHEAGAHEARPEAGAHRRRTQGRAATTRFAARRRQIGSTARAATTRSSVKPAMTP